MRFRLKPFLCLALALAALPAPARAQEPNDGTIRILRPIIHGEQDKAELCLEFDRAADISDRGRGSLSLKLESGGKSLAVSAANISLLSNLLCIASLDHRREYRLTLSSLRGAQGEKLADAYHLSFTIPDRHPSLAFASEQNGGGFLRWKDNDPVLRGINVPRVKIELYRVTDQGAMVDAWKQRAQTALAPTESAYSARKNGHLIWQGNLILGDTPNKIIEQKLPLQAIGGELTQGLYLVAASAPVAKTDGTDAGLAPLAALWLLRSDLKIRVIRNNDGIYALAQKADASGLVANAHFTLEDQNGHALADGKSDASGTAKLNLGSDKQSAATVLIGTTDTGDVDFADLAPGLDKFFTTSALAASVTTDKNFYASGDTVAVTLGARDMRGHATAQNDSRLQILRPDRSLYATLPVPKDTSGTAHLSFPVPAGNGVWRLVWQQNDGHTLAETSLRLTVNPDAPRIEMTADRSMLGDDGEVNLDLKSLTYTGKAAPYITGRIFSDASAPDHVFGNWDDYHFGTGDAATPDKKQVAAFITDATGMAHVKLTLTPLANASSLRAVALSIESDPAAGAADPAPLTLPFKPKDYVVGIKALAADSKFAENSVAQFSIIALDANGQRRGADNLTYQIYEEGRSFDWYQADGRWDYKPLQQRRRMGGSALNIKADGSSVIDWPVTAGTYRLDITNAEGDVVSRIGFNAGWGAMPDDAPKRTALILTAPANAMPGIETKIHFKLDQPSLITAVIADDQIRNVIHQAVAVGDGDITFIPGADWGDKIRVSIDTDAANGAGKSGQVTLTLATAPNAAKDAKTSPIIASAFTVTGLGPFSLHQGDTAQLAFALENNMAAGAYHYAVSAATGLKITGGSEGSITLAAGQSRNLNVGITAVQTGAKDIKIEMTGPHGFRLSQSWPVGIESVNKTLNDVLQPQIAGQQSWSPPTDDKNRGKAAYVFVGQQPLFDTPEILAGALDAQPFATKAIANTLDVLRLWRDTILQANLRSAPTLAGRQNELLLRLLARQKADGSFPALTDGDADITATASAIAAIGTSNHPLAKRAADQAANWLKQRLGNSWFDESERPERAAAYAGLAAAGRLDVANLYYFGDTSADKNMPPLAKAQLAYAFAKNNDADKARLWLADAAIDPNSSSIPSALLPYLADNALFDAAHLAPALEKLSDTLGKRSTPDGVGMSAFLQAMYFMQARAGTSRIAINNSTQDLKNILVAALPEKSPMLTLHNLADKPIFAVLAREKTIAQPNDVGLKRHIYRMNGSEIMTGDSLEHGETYLVLLEGAGLGGDILIHDDTGPALDAVSCALDGNLETEDVLSWLKNIASPSMCEKTGNGINAMLSTGDTWRVAYLATANGAGTFTALPPSARSLATDKQSKLQGAASIIQIR